MSLNIKRAYEPADEEDGTRILVDRMWPRGVSKEELQLDHWLKDAAPSPDLRKWFAHDPDKFHEFKEKYTDELAADDEKQEAVKHISSYVYGKSGMSRSFTALKTKRIIMHAC